MTVEANLPIDRPEAMRRIEAYLLRGCERTLDAATRGRAGHDDLQSFALMQGSGNGLSVFEKYLSLAVRDGAISRSEAIRFAISASGGGQL